MTAGAVRWIRRLLVPAIVIAVCATTYAYSVRPALSQSEEAELAGSTTFEAVALNAATGPRTQRDVAPEYESIRSWISAVGAAVGLADLAGTGRSSDACLVDTRDDSVQLIPLGSPGDAVALTIPPAEPDRPWAPMGCVPADLDADGDEDLVVYFWGRPPLMFTGTGDAVADLPEGGLEAHELVDPTEIWNSTALNVGDIDGDGQLDLLVANYFPDGVGVLDPSGSAVAPEMQDSMSAAVNAGTNRLLLTTPAGPDEPPLIDDATAAFPQSVARSWTLATGLQDLDGDQLPEIYLANDFGNDHLLANRSTPGSPSFEVVRGDRTMTDPKSKVLGRDSFKGMGVTFSHLDGDHAPSIFVSNITSTYALQESNFAFVPGDGDPGELPTYRDRSESLGLSRSGWSWDVQAIDVDNDGVDEIAQATGFLAGEVDRWPELQELAMGNDSLLHDPAVWPTFGDGDDLSGHEPNRLWKRAESGRFYDVGGATGFGVTDVSRGIAVGDVDGDGAADLVVANQWAQSHLYRNATPDPAPAAEVVLHVDLGEGRSRTAFGATVHADGVGDLPPLTRQIHPANGHASSSSPAVLVPLPDGAERELTVSWRSPDGTVHQGSFVADGVTHLTLHNDGSIHSDG